MLYKFLSNGDTAGSPVTFDELVYFSNGHTLAERIFHPSFDDIIYPVGRIIETVGDFNPNGVFNGYWEKVAINQTLMSDGEPALQDKPSPVSLTLADNSKWDLIYFHEISGGLWASSSDCLDYDLDAAHTKFGKMKYLQNYYSKDGELELLLVYNTPFGEMTWDAANAGRWRQIGSPWALNSAPWKRTEKTYGYNATAPGGHTDVMEDLYVPWDKNWTGLAKCRNEAYAFFDGNNGRDDWFFPIGQATAYSGAIPAHINATNCALYVRKDNVELQFYPGMEVGANTHLLTINEMPSHGHGFGATRTGSKTNGYNDAGDPAAYDNNDVQYVGGGLEHNNIQPAIYINYWERIY